MKVLIHLLASGALSVSIDPSIMVITYICFNLNQMSKASVQYLGGIAYYEIIAENKGILTVELIEYSGPDLISPPTIITMARGRRKWIGSINDDLFLDKLGKEIERLTIDGFSDISFNVENNPY
jgi:hypothetical protein